MRRWMMWAAVSLGSTWKRSLPWKALSVAWFLTYAAAAVALVLGRLRPLQAVLVLASPVVLALVWRDRYRVGLIAAHAILVLTVPTVLVALAWGVYLVAERMAQLALRARGMPAYPVRLSRLPGYGQRPGDDGLGSGEERVRK